MSAPILDGKYRILAELGQGGAGVVYQAEHVFLRKMVAVKLLRRDFAGHQDVAMRFEHEARATALLDHENIVRVIDFGRIETGEPYLVMEYLEGRSLYQETARLEGRMPVDRVLAIMRQVLRGLEVAHGQGIVHRDLKPENVFLLPRPAGGDLVKLLDFGIAKLDRATMRLTATGSLLGTPLYMAPEQARGESDVDGRADLHAVGAMLYELLAGRTPYEGDTHNVVLFQILRGNPQPLPPTVDRTLSAIAFRALETAREKRFPTAKAMREEIERLLAARSKKRAGARAPGSLPRPPPPARAPAASEGEAGAGTASATASLPDSSAPPPTGSADSNSAPATGDVEETGPALRAEVRFASWQVLAFAFEQEIVKGIFTFELLTPVPEGSQIELGLGLPSGEMLHLNARVTKCIPIASRGAAAVAAPLASLARKPGQAEPPARHQIVVAIEGFDEPRRNELKREIALRVGEAVVAPAEPVEAPLTFAERQQVLEVLSGHLARSDVGRLVEAPVLRDLIMETLRVLDGVLVLDHTYAALLARPGVSAALLQEPLHDFLQAQDRLPLPVRLFPPAPGEEVPGRRERGAAVPSPLERPREATPAVSGGAPAASPPAAASTSPPGGASSGERPIPKGATPAPEAPAVPRPQRRSARTRLPGWVLGVLAAGLALVAIARFGGPLMGALHRGSEPFVVDDVAGILRLGAATRRGELVVARIEELRWEQLGADEQRRLVGRIFEIERDKGIAELQLRDFEGRTRARARAPGGAVEIELDP